ncbi:MAG: cation transporter [Prevotella sp.]|jgi:Cu(I)/Ag(I) efflux system membrane fusion protein|nr:heavy metal-associated domain-containing protein [Prevotella sp.]MCH3995609.1 cation transporter [Prevotella sp.]
MKKMMVLMMSALLLSGAASAKVVKTTFKVGGVCNSCKARIEKAAQSVKGVKTASWNVESKQLNLAYDNQLTTPLKVETAIAKVGHDAGSVKASTAAYNKLPGCCKYRK